jgi:hypothetical protein
MPTLHSGSFATDPPGDPAASSEELESPLPFGPAVVMTAPAAAAPAALMPDTPEPTHSRSRSVTFFEFEIIATQ